MLRSSLTRFLIWGSNLASSGTLFRLYREIKTINDHEDAFNKKALSDYLTNWGRSSDIKDSPLMDKSDIRKYVSEVDSSKIYKVSFTGGSTGEPLKTLYSKHRTLVRTAGVLYYNKLVGYGFGDSYFLTRSRDRSSFIKFLKNEILFVPDDLSDKKLEEVARILQKRRIKILFGYPSVISELARWFVRNGKHLMLPHLKIYISTSEPLDDEVRDFIHDVLKCPVIDRYANEESGIMAQQREHKGEYFIDRYNLYIEILDPVSLMPVKEGEVGKVVVTDICSDLYPFIRYDTGDYAVAARYKNGQLMTIRQIIGRVVDQFFKTDGKPFSPLTLGPHIRLPLTKTGLNFQFQFAQTGHTDYCLRLKVLDGLVPDDIKDDIIVRLKQALGDDATISVLMVDQILARPSGKRPLYVNEIRHISQADKV